MLGMIFICLNANVGGMPDICMTIETTIALARTLKERPINVYQLVRMLVCHHLSPCLPVHDRPGLSWSGYCACLPLSVVTTGTD